jgi:hypothetical protein
MTVGLYQIVYLAALAEDACLCVAKQDPLIGASYMLGSAKQNELVVLSNNVLEKTRI